MLHDRDIQHKSDSILRAIRFIVNCKILNKLVNLSINLTGYSRLKVFKVHRMLRKRDMFGCLKRLETLSCWEGENK